MEKKRARLITGWRQVTTPRRKASIHRIPAPCAKSPAQVPARVAEGSATERWEGEGGQLAGNPAP
jgi:hypothetical protein